MVDKWLKEWNSYTDRLLGALEKSKSKRGKPNILIVSGSARNEDGCAQESSKALRISMFIADVVEKHGCQATIVDLSRLTVDKQIGPCKACYSTSPALCKFGCDCWPDDKMVKNDWMHDEIYEALLEANGIFVVTPIYWWSMPSTLKLMIDRMVCLDGANPDIKTTMTGDNTKDIIKAKALERGKKEGGDSQWDYVGNKHMAGKRFAVYVYGDSGDSGPENVATALSNTFKWMGMIPTAPYDSASECIGCRLPYSDSHAHLDDSSFVWDTVQFMAENLAKEVLESKKDGMPPPEMLPNEFQR